MSDRTGSDPRISRKGWFRADYDRNLWIPCPRDFPAGMDTASWADKCARVWWDAEGPGDHEAQIAALARQLSDVHQTAYGPGMLPTHLGFIHLPRAEMIPLLVSFTVWEALGDRDQQLRLMTHAASGIEPPVFTPFRTDQLGEGIKVLYYQRTPERSTVIGCLAYAWRSEQYDTDLRILTICPNLGRLEAALPDLDDLARATRMVPGARG